MRDKIGDHEDRMDSIFGRLLVLENQIDIVLKRINWLENPETAPKSAKTDKAKPPEGKL